MDEARPKGDKNKIQNKPKVMKHPNTENARSSRTARFAYFAAVFGAACFAFSNAGTAQSLDDWKAALSAAKSGKGADSIPYSSLRSDVDGKRSSIEDFCKKESWTCDGLETKSLREEIKNRSQNIESIKKQIDALTKELESKSGELELKQMSLKTDMSDCDIRIAKGTKCVEARTAVQSAFKSAIDKAKSESDTEVKKIASELISYWEKGAETHKEAIEATKAGIEKCQKCKNGDL